MAETTVALKDFVEKLAEIAQHAPDAEITINGEAISSYSITMLNPVAEFAAAFGRKEIGRDPLWSVVVDISANGRDVENLPVTHYPYERPR